MLDVYMDRRYDEAAASTLMFNAAVEQWLLR